MGTRRTIAGATRSRTVTSVVAYARSGGGNEFSKLVPKSPKTT